MTKKVNITIVAIIVIISLAISIYIPNKDRLSGKKEDTSKNYQTIEENGKVGVKDGESILIEPQYDKIIIPNEHRDVFMCQNGEEKKFVNSKNEKIFDNYDAVELIEYDDSKLTLEQVEKFVDKAGFTSLGIDNLEKEEKKKSNEKYKLIGISVISILIL